MKNPDRAKVTRLDELPNIGKAMAQNLRLIGIDHPMEGGEPLS
ncbi:MAG: helix-hairpin-helix domain-containing protein [Pedobacter sp.]